MPFVIKTEGGPEAGVRVTDNLDEYGLSWPLPEFLDVEQGGGRYRKVSESIAPAEFANDPHFGLGAAYIWEPDES